MDIEQKDIETISSCFVEISDGPPRNPERCKQLAEWKGLDQIGSGGERFAYQFNSDSVVKFPVGPYGQHQNKQEAEIWNKVEGTESENIFATVHSSANDGSWLIMQKVDTNTDDRHGINLRADMKEDLHKHGWKCEDVRERNIGKRPNGERVFLDYGMGCEKL